MRLFCFPFAGGSAASYAQWQVALGREIHLCAVQPPGRGTRFGETPRIEWSPLLSELVESLQPLMDLPYAFFGHSLGGLVAFELARALSQLPLLKPRHLFISATNAPSAQPKRPEITQMNDHALIARLREYGGTPAEILENQELMDLILPTIRADLTLLQNYRYTPAPPLALPITVLAGKRDSHLAHNALSSWQHESSSKLRLEYFHGDHFYLQAEREEVLSLVRESLRAIT